MVNINQAHDIALHAVSACWPIFEDTSVMNVRVKSDRDIVTSLDLLIEDTIHHVLQETYPDIPFVGEETHQQDDSSDSEYLWVLDPIDGTSNFVHGLELCAISLALLHEGEPIMGVISAPRLQKTYTAIHAQGAYCNKQPITIAHPECLSDAIATIGDYAVGENAIEKNQIRLHATQQLIPHVHRIRMLGTAALDLAFLAEGHTDIAVIFTSNPWDIAAGKIIAQEAGATITTIEGKPHQLASSTNLLATSLILSQEITRILSP